MKLLILRTILFLLLPLSVFTQIITRGPYLQSGTSKSIIIRWRTETEENSRVRYGRALDTLNFSVQQTDPVTEHVIEIKGLLPSTRYYYTVGTLAKDLAAGPHYYFSTAPLSGETKETRVWIIGDAGTAGENQKNVRDAFLKYSAGRQEDLWIMLGDNAYQDGKDSEYQDAVFKMYPLLLGRSVLWPAFGNHDARSADSRAGTGPFYEIFSLPDSAQAGGVPSGTEAYYSFEYANIHFICLNSHDIISNDQFDEMITWLKSDLTSQKLDWTIAFWHHPPYSKGSHNSDSNSDSDGRLVRMREDVLPLLESSGVDMVLSGHSHSYERSYLIDGHYGYSHTLQQHMILDKGNGQINKDGAYKKKSTGPAAHEGTVYIVAGSAAKTSGGSLDHPVMFRSLNALGSVILDINDRQLDLTFIDDDVNNPSVLDYLTMIKGMQHSLTVALAFFRVHESHSADGVLLEWKTDSEFDNAYWLVQRKKAGSTRFQSIKEIKSQGDRSHASYYEFLDNTVTSGQSYTYRLADVSVDGIQRFYNELNITVSLPDKIELSKNYPNPFNPSTSFKLKIPVPQHVDVSVYNQLGKKIKTLLHATMTAGSHVLQWDGSNMQGDDVTSGIYYVKAISKRGQAGSKIMLIR